MKISVKVYNEIIKNKYAYETGGILGGNDGIITHCFFDEGCENKGNSYKPNIYILNQIIERWSKENINFYGIYHTHPVLDQRLSKQDIEYIELIMIATPEYIEVLYFPLLLPNDELIFYKATKNNGVFIKKEAIELVE